MGQTMKDSDHDSLITVISEVKNIAEDQKTLSVKHDEINEKVTNFSINMNQLADKIGTITQNDKSRLKFIATIISGIIITVVSATVIYYALNKRDINTIKMNDKIDFIVDQLTDLKPNKIEIEVKDEKEYIIDRG